MSTRETLTDKLFNILIVILILAHLISIVTNDNALSYQLKFIIPILMIILWIIKNKLRIKVDKNELFIYIIMYIFLINILLSSFNHQLTFFSLIQGGSYFLLIFTSLIIYPEFVRNKNDYVFFLKLFLYSLLFFILLSIFIDYVLNNGTYTYFDNRPRYTGFFDNPIALAINCLIGIISSISLWILTGKKKFKCYPIIFMIVIYYTDSRGVLISTIIFMLAYLVFKGLNYRNKSINHLIKGMLLILFAYITIFIVKNIGKIKFTHIDKIFNNRLSRIIIATANLKGVDYLKGAGIGSRLTNPHNAIIDILIQLGLLGVFIIVSLLLFHFYKAIKIFLHTESNFSLNLSIIGMIMIMTFFILGFSESIWLSSGNLLAVFIWANLGIQSSLFKPNYEGKRK